MNMIMNPTEMIKKDPIAKALLMEYNNAIMLNQNVNQQDARALLEYISTLDHCKFKTLDICCYFIGRVF